MVPFDPIHHTELEHSEVPGDMDRASIKAFLCAKTYPAAMEEYNWTIKKDILINEHGTNGKVE